MKKLIFILMIAAFYAPAYAVIVTQPAPVVGNGTNNGTPTQVVVPASQMVYYHNGHLVSVNHPERKICTDGAGKKIPCPATSAPVTPAAPGNITNNTPIVTKPIPTNQNVQPQQNQYDNQFRSDEDQYQH